MTDNLQEIDPANLFYIQKAAFLEGNMELVKEIAAIAKNRLAVKKTGTWEQAKSKLDSMPFPEKIEYEQRGFGEQHTPKKAIHKLITYINKNPMDILGYDLRAKYNYCEECKEVRNKFLTIFNNEESTSYTKVFKLHGKNPDAIDWKVAEGFVISLLILVPLLKI